MLHPPLRVNRVYNSLFFHDINCDCDNSSISMHAYESHLSKLIFIDVPPTMSDTAAWPGMTAACDYEEIMCKHAVQIANEK